MKISATVDLLGVALFQNFNQDSIKMQFKLQFKSFLSQQRLFLTKFLAFFPKNH